LAEVGKPFESTFIILYALSYIFLVIALLSAYALNVTQLQAYSSVYLAMLTTALFSMRGIEPPKNLGKGLLYGIPSLFTISAVSQFFRQAWHIGGVLPTLPAVAPALLLNLIMNIAGPTAEEGFFRIGLINMLKPVMGETWAIITQAAIFGIYHYYAYKMDILAMTTAAIAGLALGIIYAKTGSESSITISHIIFNFTVILMGGP
jgi:membrane protease YdiL (CAAX protease family)